MACVLWSSPLIVIFYERIPQVHRYLSNVIKSWLLVSKKRLPTNGMTKKPKWNTAENAVVETSTLGGWPKSPNETPQDNSSNSRKWSLPSTMDHVHPSISHNHDSFFRSSQSKWRNLYFTYAHNKMKNKAVWSLITRSFSYTPK